MTNCDSESETYKILQWTFVFVHFSCNCLYKAYEKYAHFQTDDFSDPEMNRWFLMNSLWIPILIIGVYFLSLVLGPKLMKNRKPFNIKKVITIYNAIQVIFNVYLFYLSTHLVWINRHKFLCMKVVCVETEEGYYEQRMFYWLLTINKMLDLLDTIFFVLKNKSSHVSFLHVYHHVLTFAGSWSVTRYYPGGHFILLGVLNSFVHCVMYSYYLLSLADRMKNICAFLKKHITQLQIIQLIIMGLYAVYGLMDPACNHYPRGIVYYELTQASVLTVLFINFYHKAYLKSRKTIKKIH